MQAFKHLLLWVFLPWSSLLLKSSVLLNFMNTIVDAAGAFVPSKFPSIRFSSSSSCLRPIQQERTPPVRIISALPFASKGDEEEKEVDDDEQEENPSSPSSLRRRRDRIRDWISTSGRRSSSGSSPMVRPIRMEDGSIVEDTPAQPSRLKANFGELFSGMPSMSDMLGSSDEEDMSQTDGNKSQNDRGGKSSRNKRQTYKQDEFWFEEERKQIEANYAQILKEMINQLDEQRKQGPDSVPSNAEAMITDILKQEMNTEISETKEARAKDRLEEYRKNGQESVDSMNVEGVSNEVVENLMKEDQKERKRKEAEQTKADEYRRYELEAFLKKPDQDSGVSLPQQNANLDQWALERLQAMAEKSHNSNGDEEFMVTDLVEERMEDLRERIEKEAQRSSIKPETMKEWQMYRAISSRMGIGADAKNPTAAQGDERTEHLIASRLQSWKDYLGKEEAYRKDSGLSRGPRLPFDWQESGRDQERSDARYQAALKSRGEMSKVEIRKEVNRKSIEALEKLVATSDPIRSERLRKDLELLKESLESNDYLDVDESTLQEDDERPILGPVDLSDFFASSRELDDLLPSPRERFRQERNRSSGSPPGQSNTDGLSEFSPSQSPGTPFSQDGDEKPPPPDTPFFSQHIDDMTEDKPQPPNTPFFSEKDNSEQVENDQQYDYALGSIDEQKLRNMYQRAGARTDEQKAVIRKQWEGFQEFEKSRRDELGLGDGDGSESLRKVSLKYNMSDVAKDGDIDAAKILASIGPRPKRRQREDKSGSSAAEGDSLSEVKYSDDDSVVSNLDQGGVSESLYRAYSAVGGGRTKDDPAAKAREKAAFSEYMSKEDELRRSLETMDGNSESNVTGSNDNFDDAKYAENILASLGPRPEKRQKISESEYSDKGIALSDDEDDDEMEDDESAFQESRQLPPAEIPSDDNIYSRDGPVPAWLRKERESARSRSGIAESFLGSEIDDVFDDNTYEHNMRQLAEYERRRQGGKRQMGIDISDVLSRDSDDYADYNYDDNYFRGRSSGWGSSGFGSRKADLLEYTELNLQEIKSLMDYKDSAYSTGVSQYLPRINKPFKEFGAIFRLEGVLLDTTGFQYEAWTKVASDKGLKAPTLEDVRRASVMRPHVAIQEAFFWTDDIILIREIAAAHQKALDDVFKQWMKDACITLPAAGDEESAGVKGDFAIEGRSISNQSSAVTDRLLSVPEDERLKILRDAWSRTAVVHRLAAPTGEQVEMASVLFPDIAVREAFRWSRDPADVDKIAATYRKILRGLCGDEDDEPSNEESATASGQSYKRLDVNTMLEIQYKAWTKLAEDNDFEAPLPEEVMAAVTINDPLISIRDGFGWTSDPSQLRMLVNQYKSDLDALISDWRGGSPASSNSAEKKHDESAETEDNSASTVSNGPSKEELLEMQHYAWKSAALNHGFKVPPSDQLELAMKMAPNEAVARLFDWTTEENTISAICATFDSALKNISQQYLKKYNLKPDFVLFPQQQYPSAEKKKTGKGPSKNVDVFQAAFDAWTEVAKKKGFKLPDEDEVLFAMSVGPEEAVVSGFEWVEPGANEEVSKIVESYKEELKPYRSKWESQEMERNSNTSQSSSNETMPMFSLVSGAEKWVKSLLDVEMQCVVVSYFTREQLDVLLEVAGLSRLFSRDKRVSASNNYPTDVDQLLGAALRLERRPDHCAVFDSSPHASVAAHDVEMRSVSVVGPFPRYDLLTADSTAASFDELTAMNIRRLFGERVYDQPLVDAQQTDPEIRRKPKTKYRWSDE